MTPLFDYFVQMFDMQQALGWTLMVAALTCVMSFLCSLVSNIDRFKRNNIRIFVIMLENIFQTILLKSIYSLLFQILGFMDKRRETKLHLEIDETEVVRLRDIFSFPPIFWFCSIVCLAYYVAIFPFISLGQVFFMKKFDMSSSEANFINGRVVCNNNFICKCYILNLKLFFLDLYFLCSQYYSILQD